MQLSDSYLAHSLRNTEVAGYRAGGVLLFSHMPTTSPGSTKAEPHVLIGKELRSSRSDPIGQLGFCLLGGKRDESDLDPAETALREFVEESGNVLTTSQKEQLRAQMTSPSADIFWYLPAKYCLYLLPLPPTATPEWAVRLPERHKLAVGQPSENGDEGLLSVHKEMESLHWIRLSHLLARLSPHKNTAKQAKTQPAEGGGSRERERGRGGGEVLLDDEETGASIPLTPFVASCLRHPEMLAYLRHHSTSQL
ncbi:hypothetical protein QOT17_012150 [Balamuthia mandrillaris]